MRTCSDTGQMFALTWQHVWLGSLCEHCTTLEPCQTSSSGSQWNNLHYVVELTLGCAASKGASSGLCGRTLFAFASPLISQRAWSDAQGTSRGYLTPTLCLLSPLHFLYLSLLLPACYKLTDSAPNPQPHPASNVNNHIKAVWQARAL